MSGKKTDELVLARRFHQKAITLKSKLSAIEPVYLSKKGLRALARAHREIEQFGKFIEERTNEQT